MHAIMASPVNTSGWVDDGSRVVGSSAGSLGTITLNCASLALTQLSISTEKQYFSQAQPTEANSESKSNDVIKE